MDIVRKIQVLCSNNGMTLTSLEKELGFSKSSISRWNTNSPSIDKVQKVADFFEVSIDYLLDHPSFTPWIERGEIKNKFYTLYPDASIEDKKLLAKEYLFQYYNRSLEASNFSRRHVPFEEYAGMLLSQKYFKDMLSDVYDDLTREYPPIYGVIGERKTYYYPENDFRHKSNNAYIGRIARAGEKLTEEQSEQLLKYAKFMFPEAFDEEQQK